jgi:SAM-dependent methyltransferase
MLGKQFVAEACDLKTISNGMYDFVVASHVLEHIANPLRALQEWKRVLNKGGTLLVVVPDRSGTFDRKRPFTAFEHIEADFRQNVSEDDLTHLDEVLALHDLSLDPLAGSREQFRDRCVQNPSMRAMHHHVFTPDVVALMFSQLQMRVLNISVERPYHIIALGQKHEG